MPALAAAVSLAESVSMVGSSASQGLGVSHASSEASAGVSGLTFRGSLNAFARNFPAVGSSGAAGSFQVDEALGLLLPGSHELLGKALVVDGLLQ